MKAIDTAYCFLQEKYRQAKEVVEHEKCYYEAVACIYLYIHTVVNTTILQLVAIYNIQLHPFFFIFCSPCISIYLSSY